MKILFLESVSGVAGDMFAASFVDSGLIRASELESLPRTLGLEGVQVKVTKKMKATMQATHINVVWSNEDWKKAVSSDHSHGSKAGVFKPVADKSHSHANLVNKNHHGAHWHTHYKDLDRFLERSELDLRTKTFARRVFATIAQAEAEAHGMSIEDIAFHEVGAVDSIVDVVMAAYCIGKIDPQKIYATPVKLGRGTVTIEHGTHPVPPPAAARLVVGMPVAPVPSAIERQNVELSTPTGLAILKVLNPEFVDAIPQGQIVAQGMGAGTMDLGQYPNVFRIFVLEEKTALAENSVQSLPFETDKAIELCCNIDDQTAERTAWIMEELMAKGALDVWATPVTAKKGRAAVCLSVLAKESDVKDLADWLLRMSTTFGLRYRTWDRIKLVRRFETRLSDSGKEIRYKVGLSTKGEILKEKPEYEDLREIWKTDPDYRPK